VFVIAILGLTFLISLVATPSIFKLGVWSFTGFSGLFPIVVAALYWRRSTRHGVMASILTVVVLWVYFFIQAWSVPGYTVGGSGVIPAAVILLASSVVLVVVSLLTAPPEAERLERFFGDAESSR
jgi:SSS family solute:Na+ symporter